MVDTRHLSFEEQGLYLNLLLMQFDKGRVDLQLVRKLWPELYGKDRSKAMLQGVLEQFFTTDTGPYAPAQTYRRFWVNKRMYEVVQEQRQKSEKRTQQTARARSAKQQKAKTVTKSVTEAPAESVTKPVTKRELEKELELELEPKKDLDYLPRVSEKRSEAARPTIELAVQLWNDKAIETGALAQVKRITEARRTKWNRLCGKAGYYNSWCESLHRLPVVNTATFQWQPTFDWTLNETNITKLSEGNYEQSKNYSRKTRVAKFVEGS